MQFGWVYKLQFLFVAWTKSGHRHFLKNYIHCSTPCSGKFFEEPISHNFQGLASNYEKKNAKFFSYCDSYSRNCHSWEIFPQKCFRSLIFGSFMLCGSLSILSCLYVRNIWSLLLAIGTWWSDYTRCNWSFTWLAIFRPCSTPWWCSIRHVSWLHIAHTVHVTLFSFSLLFSLSLSVSLPLSLLSSLSLSFPLLFPSLFPFLSLFISVSLSLSLPLSSLSPHFQP